MNFLHTLRLEYALFRRLLPFRLRAFSRRVLRLFGINTPDMSVEEWEDGWEGFQVELGTVLVDAFEQIEAKR